jgi:hypothetical protein
MKVVEIEINTQLEEYLLNYIKYNYNNAPEDGEEFNAPTDELIREHIKQYISHAPFAFKETEEEDEWLNEQHKIHEDIMLEQSNEILQEKEPEKESEKEKEPEKEPEPVVVKKIKKNKKAKN